MNLTDNSNQNRKRFNAIRSIVFFYYEKLEVVQAPKHKKRHIDKRDLPQILKDARYKCISVANGHGCSGHSFLVINISRDNAKRHFGMIGLSSFVFIEFNKSGATHTEYLEKQNVEERYHYKDNDFVIREESDLLAVHSATEDKYTFIGEHYHFSVTFSVLESIDDAIYFNICRFLRKLKKEEESKHVETILEYAINRVGFTPMMYRQAIIKSLL